MNQTTTNLPNRTDLQSCNSLSFGKRMTFPLSGRSLRRGALAVVGLMAVMGVGISSVQAAGTTNTNSVTTSFNWTNASWTGGAYPGSTNWTLTNNTSLAYFNALTNAAITLNDNLNLQSVTFSTTAISNTVSGSGTLFLTTGGTILNNSTNASATNAINNNIAFVGGAGTYTFNSANNNNSNALAINGAITSSNTGTTTMLVGGAGSNLKILFGGNIIDSSSNMINLIAGGGGNSPSTSTGLAGAGTGLSFSGNNSINSLLVGGSFSSSAASLFTGSNNVRTSVNVLQGATANTSALVVSGANGYLIATNGINVGINGILVYDNGATSVTNRFGNSVVTLNGGRFITTATNTVGSSWANVAQINLGANYTSYLTNNGAATGANTLTIGSISAGSNATLQTTLNGATNNGGRVIVTSAPTLTAGILPWAVDTVSGAFLTYSNSGVNNFLGGYGSISNNVYLTNATSAWDASSNVAITASTTTNTGNNSVNSLSFKNSAAGTLTLGGANTLTVASGGILSASNFASGITGGFITAGTGAATNLYLWNLGTSTQSIGSGIVDNGSGVITLNKSGSGTVALTGTNTYSGDTYIQQGTLSLASGGVLGNGNYAGQVILNGGTLNFASGTNQTISGNVNGTNGGTLLVNGGVLTLSGSSNSFAAITNGTVTSATGLSQLNIAGNGTTTSSGNIGVGYGNAPSATNMLTVASGATLNAQANLSVGGNTGLNKLSNAGTINMTNGAATQYLQFGTGGSGTYTFDTTGNLSITGSGDRRFQMSAGASNSTTIANFLSGSTSTISYFIVGGSGQSNNNTATIYTNAVVNVTSTNNVLAYSDLRSSVNTLTLAGGLFSGSTFTLGFASTNTATNNLNTLNLGSGTIALSGSLTTGANTAATNVFNWTGGTLSVNSIVATNSGSGWAAGNTASSISNNTLYNTNAGTLLVGTTNSTNAGRTIIQGSYNQNGSATTTFNIFGTTQASSWTGATNAYSFLSATTNATLAGGKVVLNFGSFVPATNNTFNLLTATAANGLSVTSLSSLLGGANAYANASGSNVAFAGDGLTYVALTTNGTNLTGTAALNQWKGGSGNWTATNFSGGVAPNSTSLGGYFTNSGGTVTLTNNVAVNSLTLSNATGYALAGGSSTLTVSKGNGTGVTLTSSAGSNSIAPAIAMGGTLTVVGNSALSLNGNLSDGGAGYTLLDSNSSTVNLAGSNSYSGGTLVSSGTLGFGTANSFGSGAVTNNGTLSYTGSGAANLTNAVSGTGSLLVNGSGTLALGGSQAFSGVTVQAGRLTVAGNQLSNNAVTVSGGNLAVSSSVGNVTLNSGSANISGTAGAVTVSGGTLSGTGTLGATTLNAGSTVNVSNGTAAGTLSVSSLVINGGAYTWNFFGSSSDLISSTGTVTFSNTPSSKFNITVNYAGSGWNNALSTNYSILTGASYTGFDASAFSLNSGNASANGTWSLSNNSSSGLILVYTANSSAILVSSPAGITTLQSVATNTIFADGGTATALAMNGAGEYVLDMNNTYSGITTIGSGTLSAANNSSFGNSPTLYLGTSSNGGSNATLNINTAGVRVTANVNVQGSGTNVIGNSSSGLATYSGAVSLLTNATVANSAGGSTILSGVISGNSALAVSPGSGTVTLAAANTYSGGTTLNGGTLAVSNNTALGSGTLAVTANGTLQAATSVRLANNQTVATSVTETLNANGNSFTNAGNISGNGSLAVTNSQGSGTVTLSGSNSYAGATTVDGGTLALGSSTALPTTTTLTVGNTGILNLSGNNASVAGLASGGSGASITSGSAATLTVNTTLANSFFGTIGGSVALTKSGSGTLTIGGNNTYTGTTLVNAGGFVLNGSISNSALTVTNATFTEGSGGSINGTTGVTVNSNSIVTLNGINTFTGGTTINGGIVTLGNASALSSGGLTNSGTLDLGGYNLTYGTIGGNGVITNSSGASVLTFTNTGASTFAGSLRDGTGTLSLVKNGNGTLTMTGASTMAGSTVINAGGLILTNGGSLANSALTITNVGYTSVTYTNAAGTTLNLTSSTNGLVVGQLISGSGIAAGTTITAINAGSITISAAATVNSSSATGGAYTSTGTVQAFGSSLTNVTVAGNATSYTYGTQSGNAGTANFVGSNSTVNGVMTIAGPATGTAYMNANAIVNSAGANYGYATFNSGMTVTNVLLNGRLDILGSGSMSVSGISGTSNGQTYYTGGGSGVISLGNTYSAANVAGGYGNILNFTAGSVFAGLLQSTTTNSAATFTQTGSGTVTFGQYQGNWNGSGVGAQNQNYTFSGGNWQIGKIGQGNSGQQVSGTNSLVNGANVSIGDGSQSGGVWLITNGTMTFQNGAAVASSFNTTGQTLGLVVSSNGSLYVNGTFTEGGKLANTTFYLTNNGGLVNISNNLALGGVSTVATFTNLIDSVSFNSGTNSIGGNLTIGNSYNPTSLTGGSANNGTSTNITTYLTNGLVAIQTVVSTNTNSSPTPTSTNTVYLGNVTNTVTLAGGSLSVAGTISVGSGVQVGSYSNITSTNNISTNSFVWTGGTLSARTITATGTNWNGANSSITGDTLYNSNGVLAPGTLGVAGKTTITGNYVQSGSGTLSLDVLGNTAASSFTNANAYDLLFVTGTNTMGGTLNVAIGNGVNIATNSLGTDYILLQSSVTNTGSYSTINLTGLTGTNGVTSLGSTSYGNYTNFMTTNGYGVVALIINNKTIDLSYQANAWNGTTNWGSGGASAWSAGINASGTNYTAYFGSAGNRTVNINQNTTIGGLIFTNSSGYTLTTTNGSALTLDGSYYGGKALIQNQAGNQTIASGVILNTAMELTNSGSATVTFGGGISGTGAIIVDSGTLGLSNAVGSITVNNNISGAGSVGIYGSGTTVLAGSNSFTGLLNLQAGTAALSGTNAAGAGSIFWGSSALQAAVDLSGANALTNAVALNSAYAVVSGTNNITLSGQFTQNGANRTITDNLGNNATLTLSGPVYLSESATGSRTLTLAGTGNTVVSGSIADYNGSGVSSSLTKSGTGTLTLSGNNTYTGGTLLTYGTLNVGNSTALGTGSVAVSGGTLALGGYTINNDAQSMTLSGGTIGGGTITSDNGFNGFSNGTISAVLTGAGALTKSGTGTLTLSGVNTYTAGTLLNAGGLNITTASSLGAGDLVMNGGTKFAYTGIGAATLANNINLSSGNGTIANSSGSDLTLSGNLTNSGSGLTLAGGTFNLNGTISGDYSLSNATANLSGLNSYGAPSSILAGSSLRLGGNDNLTTGSALNFGATTDLSSQTNMLNLAGYNQTVASVANVGSSASQIIDSVGGGTFTLTGNSLFRGSFGGLTTTSAQRNLNLTVASGANVNLTGNNTYTGTTTIQQGATLDLGNGGSLSGSTNVNLNGGTLLLGGNGRTDSVNTNTALSLNGGTLSMGGTNATSRSASQTFASLTLTADSTIDFANLSGDSSITFANIVMNGNTLNIFDWSGTTFYGDQQSSTQVGTFTHLYDLSSLSASDLSNIHFYAGNDTSSQFLGIGGFSGNEIVPVPEPGVIVAAIMLLGCLVFANRGMLIALINCRRVA